jgi:hypothetical protein
LHFSAWGGFADAGSGVSGKDIPRVLIPAEFGELRWDKAARECGMIENRDLTLLALQSNFGHSINPDLSQH